MTWRTDKPTEKVIVAKLTEDFCHIKDNYSLLYLADKPYQHYCEYGEEIPYAAIEKWASLEEDKLPEGLEEASHTSSEEFVEEFVYNSAIPFPNSEYIAHRIGFKAGAKWQAEKDKEIIEVAEDHAMLAGMNKMKEEMMEKWLKDRDGCFWDGVEEGKKAMERQMLENVVDGRYMKADGKVYVESWPLDIDPDSVKAGDEVRLIVIPE